METIFELARHYYQDYNPPLWGKDRLDKLVEAGKLTRQEAEQITGEDVSE